VLTGTIQLRHSLVAGRPVVVEGRLPGLDLAELAEDATATVARIAVARAAVLSRS